MIFLLFVCFTMCAYGNKQTETTETIIIQATAESIEAATIPATTLHREPGPESLEANAVAIANVSVEYLNELPNNIKSSSTYSICGFKDEFALNDSQVYAEIHFTITNKTTSEMKIADIHDDFLVELIYDNRYVYSTDTNSWSFFKSGAQTAVVSERASIGSVTLAPLTTKDVIVYMPCAKEVSTELDKYLIVVFTSNYSGYENLEFTIR